MKLITIVLCLFLFSCGSKQVVSQGTEPILPMPLPTQRQLASEADEYIGKSFTSFFETQNYITRIERIKTLAKHLHSLMDRKGHPRRRLLQKFQDDLEKKIGYLKELEGTDRDSDKSLPIGWLPQKDSDQYSAKIQALLEVHNSGEVMAELERFLDSTKVMEDVDYEQNFFYGLMTKALNQLEKNLQQVNSAQDKDLLNSKFSYADFFASVASMNLYKVVTSKVTEKKIKTTLKKVGKVRTILDAKAYLKSKDVIEAESILKSADAINSSDIEGVHDDMETKIATYFSLAMIKHLYTGLN